MRNATSTSLRHAKMADVAELAKAHVDSWHETYTGLIDQTYLDSLSYQAREKRWAEIISTLAADRFVVTARHPRYGIIGVVTGGAGRDPRTKRRGEIYGIYVLKKAQGLGLGQRLLKRGFAELRKRGFSSFYLWVLATNLNARGFYRHMGGKETGRKMLTLGARDYEEVRVVFQG